jgi:hypothetical protein
VPIKVPPKRVGECNTLIETQALLTLPMVRAFLTRVSTPPSADFCCTVRAPYDVLRHDSVTHSRSPVIRSTAFHAQPPNLPPVPLMDTGFAISCSLARHRRPHIRFLFIGSRVCSTLPSDPLLPMAPLRFPNRLPPSDSVGDSHPHVVDHARHTKSGRLEAAASERISYFFVAFFLPKLVSMLLPMY